MIKAKRAEDADIGAEPKVQYSFRLTLEHAAFLDRILIATQQLPADWLTEVLREEIARVGVEAPPPAQTQPEPPKQGTLFDASSSQKPNRT